MTLLTERRIARRALSADIGNTKYSISTLIHPVPPLSSLLEERRTTLRHTENFFTLLYPLFNLGFNSMTETVVLYSDTRFVDERIG